MTDRVLENVAVPSLDDDTLYTVAVSGGRFESVEPTGRPPAGGEMELWPAFTETHTHLSLPCNWDETRDDPRLIALQYLYYGIGRIVDLFGFPVAAEAWEAGKAASPWPYPEVAHCGYAVTAMGDGNGTYGHGVEFPTPVHMAAVPGDVDTAIDSNEKRGATFLKVVYTEGAEHGGKPIRFTRIEERILEHAVRAAAERGMLSIVDCNTREETFHAYERGYRLFAHSVRDVDLSDADWDRLDGARFVSTLAGLRPMILTGAQFEEAYSRPGFAETQDPANLEFAKTIDEPFGIKLNLQEVRTASVGAMRRNALAALDRGRLLVGSDAGNIGAFHAWSLASELEHLAGGDPGLRRGLMAAATVTGWHYFNEMAGLPAREHPVAAGEAATFNLFEPESPPGSLPAQSVVRGTILDRDALAGEIARIRQSETKGKAVL
ncbi:amidohydrolase family protein [Salininema proteolyticum]|uniref:Hydrolase n=1 Tax=Salininema proteolyticum TaxID=1607685 RepID=A0ABV8TUH2_9ACTN